jgi:hypothetical protein
MKKSILILLLCVSVMQVFAQKSKQSNLQKMVGTYTLVSIDNIMPDSTRIHPYGTNPKGLLILDASENYAIQILKALRPKIASGDKNKCTTEENAAIVQGCNSHFGKYKIEAVRKTITFNIEAASFTNWEGTVQQRSYTFIGKELKYIVTNTTQGGQLVTAEVVWRKISNN